jgi:nucleoside 2-deoxyribosyltransferase
VHPALLDAAFRAVRSDETPTPGHIPDTMLAQINGAFAMVAIVSDTRFPGSTASASLDRTRSGVNPNVMYEVGYARAKKIPTMLLAESTEDLPFDLVADRTLTYGRTAWAELREQLTVSLRATRDVGR